MDKLIPLPASPQQSITIYRQQLPRSLNQWESSTFPPSLYFLSPFLDYFPFSHHSSLQPLFEESSTISPNSVPSLSSEPQLICLIPESRCYLLQIICHHINNPCNTRCLLNICLFKISSFPSIFSVPSHSTSSGLLHFLQLFPQTNFCSRSPAFPRRNFSPQRSPACVLAASCNKANGVPC